MSRARSLDAAATLVLCALFAMASRNVGLAMIPAMITLVSLARRDGARADAFAQIATALVAAALPAILANLTLDRDPPSGVLEPAQAALALAPLCAAATRPWFALTARGGTSHTALLSLSLVAIGQGKLGLRYASLSALCIALSLAARAAQRRDRPRDSGRSTRDVRSLIAPAALLALALSTASLGVWGLPLAHRWAVQRAIVAWARAQSVSGLSDRMGLSAMDGVLQSDALVLRVRGARTDYLRGVVFDRYRMGQWSFSQSEVRRARAVERRVSGLRDGEVEVRRLGGPAGWVLLPSHVRSIAAPEPSLDVLPSGVARSRTERDVWWFREGSPTIIEGDRPTERDTEVPRTLRRLLGGTLRGWPCGGGSSYERVRCYEQTLRERYRYALVVPESERGDPVLAFLNDHRRGHCEYFASALALLARVSGVPSRLVAGYRVHERSEWGDYWVVRERDAHAWTEVFFEDRGWVRFDATPMAASEVREDDRVPRWRTFLEALRWRLVDAWDRARATGALALLGALLALVLAASVLRRNAGAWLRRSAKVDEDSAAEAMRALLSALARRGLERRTGESLERFATRVRESEALSTLAAPACEALLAYAAERYGRSDAAPEDAPLRALAAKLDEG